MLVIVMAPDEGAVRVVFFGLLYVSLSSTFCLLAHLLRSGDGYGRRADAVLLRSVVQGCIWGGFGVTAAVMLSGRALNLASLAILLTLFAILNWVTSSKQRS